MNCWFCNCNSKIQYEDRNSWNCPNCQQYNGFTKDGDYNREMFEQLDCSNTSNVSTTLLESSNGLCSTCNDNQRIKVEKLAQFEPRKESRFDEELKAFKWVFQSLLQIAKFRFLQLFFSVNQSHFSTFCNDCDWFAWKLGNVNHSAHSFSIFNRAHEMTEGN